MGWDERVEVVIKYGGAAMVKSPERTIRDVALLGALGLKPVLVHGGGPEINSWLAKAALPEFPGLIRFGFGPYEWYIKKRICVGKSTQEVSQALCWWSLGMAEKTRLALLRAPLKHNVFHHF